jgi:hypothetical protein
LDWWQGVDDLVASEDEREPEGEAAREGLDNDTLG